MKRFALLGSSLALAALVPMAGYAAYNDVTLTTATVFSVNGITLNVNGSSAIIQSATTNNTSLSVTLLPGSSFGVLAPNKNVLTQTGGSSYLTTNLCDAASSQLGFTYPAGAGSAVTVTITPSSNTCPTGGGSGGGGGGYGAISIPIVQPSTGAAKTSAVVPPNISLPSVPPVTPSVSPNFKFVRTLKFGSKGPDVTALQRFLIVKGYLKVKAPSGFFGALTVKALQSLQKDLNVKQTGTLGPKTRAYLNTL